MLLMHLCCTKVTLAVVMNWFYGQGQAKGQLKQTHKATYIIKATNLQKQQKKVD